MLLKHLSKTPLAQQWTTIGVKHHHGIDLPLGSLRTKHSSGIGEFLDLLPLIDWCCQIGFSVIQLLPLNDSGADPSPYNALSSIALHPIYLSMHALPFFTQATEQDSSLLFSLEQLRLLNMSERVEYARVLQCKLEWLQKYYDLVGQSILSLTDYQVFLQEHSWVQGYALYKTLKNSMALHPWQEWPSPLRNPSERDLNHLYLTHHASISFYSVLQYLCHIQLKSIKDYATNVGVFIKGDIPILISPDSADVWLQRELFDLSYDVGFPPDVFNAEGQVWGFPALKWDVLKKQHYSWWKQRLEINAHYYHIYRLDHVAGFYRLWLIPKGKTPIEGCYQPEALKKAVHEGHSHLAHIVPLSSMLPIAEDLGNIPPEIAESLRSLGIPGTKVIRWERDWTNDRHFFAYDSYHPLSMTCVSTHDSETLALWWKHYPEDVKDFCHFHHWNYTRHLSKKRRLSILQAAHSTSSLFHINLFQEYLALFPDLINIDPKQERINIPGVILPTNWTYRFRCNLDTIFSHRKLRYDLETILAHAELSHTMQSLTKQKNF
jgi:4-alpha-glucanotransferase